MKTLLIIILICLGCFPLNAQLNFSAPVKYHIGTDPRSICTGDFNNDGIKDMVAYCTTLNRVAVLTGNSNGSFTTPANYTNINSGVGGLFIMSADFNNDGYDDLACANLYQKAVHILFGSGIPTFSNIVTYTFNSRPTCIDYHDVDNDGKNDLIIGAKSMDSIYVMKGDGVGGFSIINRFQPNLTVWPINLTSIDIADLNNDGNADMVINEPSKDSLLVYSGNGTGQFSYNSSLKNDVSSYQIKLKDLNSDGKIDLVSANGPNFYIFHGDGNGGFSLPSIYTPNISLGISPKVTIADFNMDGVLDLVFSSLGSDSSEMFLGNGNGNFTFALDINTIVTQHEVLSADFNNDGKPDLAYVHATNDSITIFFNKTVVENIKEQDFSFQLHVYPNPVSNRINIECDNQFNVIQVYNILSEIVLEKHYQGIRRTELYLSELKSGTYILKVDNKYIKKLTIKRE